MARGSVLTAAVLVAVAGRAEAQPVFGPFPSPLPLASLSGSNGFVIDGASRSDRAGTSVASAGDVNGDGLQDILIGAYLADGSDAGNAGKTYVIFGRPSLGVTGRIDLAAFNGPRVLTITGVDTSDRSGLSVSSAGDFNGDGIDDLVIGAPLADPNGVSAAGEAYVVFGREDFSLLGEIDLATLDAQDGILINGIDIADLSGTAVAGAGDVNGDGSDDLIIGARGADPNGVVEAGESYVVFGGPGVASGGVIDLASLDGQNGFVLAGAGAGDRSGSAVASAGDVNGDGIDDLVVGAYRADSGTLADTGEAYVVFGGAGIGSSGTVLLGELDGSDGFMLSSLVVGDQCGVSVAAAGDVNTDGVDDLIIGSDLADPGGLNNAGASYVVFGNSEIGSSGFVDLLALDGSDGFAMVGIGDGDSTGISVSAAGDANGDGFDDLIVGARLADPSGNGAAGVTYLVFGDEDLGATGVFDLASIDGLNGVSIEGAEPGHNSGRSLAGLGDVNDDGVDDMLIGAPLADVLDRTDAGRSYVVFGQSSQSWISTGGGAFEDGSNWAVGAVPRRGPISVKPLLGGVVAATSPASRAFSQLEIGSELGVTTFFIGQNVLFTIEREMSLPLNAVIAGQGVLAVEGGLTNSGLIAFDGLLVGDVENFSRLDLDGRRSPGAGVALEVAGVLTNAPGANVRVADGSVRLSTDGFVNAGEIDVLLADAEVAGDLDNLMLDASAPGRLTIGLGSRLLISGDLANDGSVILGSDSELSVLGSISGAGVLGPSGTGSAGTVFAAGLLLPGPITRNPGARSGEGAASIGALRFEGDLTLEPSSTTVFEVAGETPGVSFDQLIVARTLEARGAVRVELAQGFVPEPGSSFQLIETGVTTGAFGEIRLDPLLEEMGADSSELLTTGRLVIPVPPCLADVTTEDTNPGEPGFGQPDGLVGVTDLTYFVERWIDGDDGADVTTEGANVGDPGYGEPDGQVSVTDLTFFVEIWIAGCP
ncbi:MAG: integrin alpha [Planctomycetota bacterium]